jgi:proteasome-associated ATPase
MAKYLTPDIPMHEQEIGPHGGDIPAAIVRLIDMAVDAMYTLSDDNRFLEVTYANGDKEILYFKDFASGAMMESVVRRAKKLALKRYIASAEKGIKLEDLLSAVREEFKENEDLPNTTNPDDWARISGKKGERIVYVRTLLGDDGDGRQVERVNAGQYL